MVKLFYANLFYTDGVINSEVLKHPTTLSLEDFAQICNLPFIEKYYDQIDLQGIEFNPDTLAQSLLIGPTSIIPYPFNVGLLHPNIRLIHHTMSHILFTRKGNYNTIQKSLYYVLSIVEIK